ncbi:MAG: DMT family transporter [Desulfobulbaceae bacterium]|nr:DMT family transporter [Desulfobulbaceae bacterium]HIJ79319.1 DMT family transporter [Deltaproteobacteria bacterium]
MLWLGLSLLTALAVAIRDVSVKYFKDLPPLEIAAIELFWSLPALGAGLYLTPIPLLNSDFWWAFLLSLPLNWLAYALYLYAIKGSPLSLSIPFLSFTPVFMIATGFLVLGERVNGWGGCGTLLIVIGGYVLYLKDARYGWAEPFKSFYREKGSRLMFMVAFVFSLAAVYGKQGIINSSPLFFMYSFFIVFNLTFLAGLLWRGHSSLKKIWHQRQKGIWLGTLLVTHLSCHGLAIAITTAAYMIAVKRSSILIAVLLSWLVLKEKDLATRGPGALLMFAGVLLITLYG